MKSIYLTILLTTVASVTGCSSINSERPDHSEEQNDKIAFVKETAVENNDSSLIFQSNAHDLRVQQIKNNQEAIMSRVEQIQVSLEAAIADKVIPMLQEQPRNRTLYFKYSSPKVEKKWDSFLRKHVEYLSSDLSIRVMVAGFTDSKGSSEFNLKLGKKRADNVCKALSNLGVRKEQLTCVSYGKSHPVDPGSDDAARARNRRAELLY